MSTPRRDDTQLPWQKHWAEPRAYPPNLSENAQKVETVLYGPHGEALVQRVPRPVGFRRPDEPR